VRHPSIPAFLTIVVLLSAPVAFIGCSASPTIHAESNPMANFAAYRTYAWGSADTPLLEPLPAAPPLSGVQDWSIRNAVDASLAARGWTVSSNPDVFVVYGVAVHEMNTSTFSEYARYVSEGGRQGMAEAFVTGYQQGTLYLDLYDARTRQLVWHASASAVVSSGENTDLVRTAVEQMLAKLPSQ
jgi:hypothetical protein